MAILNYNDLERRRRLAFHQMYSGDGSRQRIFIPSQVLSTPTPTETPTPTPTPTPTVTPAV